MKSNIIKGKTILVTGGTGSFGNKVAVFLEKHNPGKIIIFSRDEKKQYEMKKQHPYYQYMVGDVRDYHRIHYALRGVHYVFHAAALKQVPSCEEHPYEAVKTNIIGSQNLCESALKNEVEVVVALSTDKAVKPINAMGISKSMMEKIICSQNQYAVDTRFCCVRYGNVMGSRGSVIPLFIQCIRKNINLPVTHPVMTRFMLTLDQSVDLVLHALQESVGGEIFVRKAPSCTVLDLAHSMIMKYGDGNTERIDITGVRPGEKMHEVLVNEYEVRRADESESYYSIFPEYSQRKNSHPEYPDGYEYTSAITRRLDPVQIVDLLDEMGEIEHFN